MINGPDKFLKLFQHPLKFRIFLFSKLPAAFFSGVRVREISEDKCVTSIPFKWLTQNPFRSTYFASLSMAAEMSTGALAMMHVYKRIPPVSMLVTKMEAAYHKKAIGKTLFTCLQGMDIKRTIEEAISSGLPQNITVKSTGISKDGQLIAEFLFTWSFKVKK